MRFGDRRAVVGRASADRIPRRLRAAQTARYVRRIMHRSVQNSQLSSTEFISSLLLLRTSITARQVKFSTVSKRITQKHSVYIHTTDMSTAQKF